MQTTAAALTATLAPRLSYVEGDSVNPRGLAGQLRVILHMFTFHQETKKHVLEVPTVFHTRAVVIYF